MFFHFFSYGFIEVIEVSYGFSWDFVAFSSDVEGFLWFFLGIF